MLKFGKDIPFEKLVGQDVWWACFSLNGFWLKFENGDSILFDHFDGLCDDNSMTKTQMIEFLISLNSYTVLNADIITEHEFILKFSNGKILRMLDCDGDMENYTFYISDIEYLV